jgi:hypothetical protein
MFPAVLVICDVDVDVEAARTAALESSLDADILMKCLLVVERWSVFHISTPGLSLIYIHIVAIGMTVYIGGELGGIP